MQSSCAVSIMPLSNTSHSGLMPLSCMIFAEVYDSVVRVDENFISAEVAGTAV